MKTESKNRERTMLSFFVYIHPDEKTGLPKRGKDGMFRGYVVSRPDLPGVSSEPSIHSANDKDQFMMLSNRS